MVDPAGQRFRTHQTTLPPSRRGCHPQVLASCSTTSRPGPPPRGEPSDRWGRRPPPVATASRCPGRTAGRPPARSPTAQVAAPPAGTGDGQRRGPGHPGTSGRWAGTTGSPTAPRTADTAGWAQHNTRLVAGQLLEGWWATLVNTATQDASIAGSPDRSQITATGRSAKRLSSALRREGTAARSSSPSGARMAHPSRVHWSIRTAHPVAVWYTAAHHGPIQKACPSALGALPGRSGEAQYQAVRTERDRFAAQVEQLRRAGRRQAAPFSMDRPMIDPPRWHARRSRRGVPGGDRASRVTLPSSSNMSRPTSTMTVPPPGRKTQQASASPPSSTGCSSGSATSPWQPSRTGIG